MTLDAITSDPGRFLLDLIQFAGVIVVGLYTWVSNRRRVDRERVTELTDRVHTLEHTHDDDVESLSEALKVLKEHVKHLPSETDVRALNANIAGVSADLAKMTGKVDGINRTVDLMHQHLLNRERGA